MGQGNKNKRDIRIDSIKGFLIFLVVLGHMIEPLYDGSPFIEIYTAIYSFHMPLFILISGFLFNPSMDKKRFWKGNLRIGEALIVFQAIRIVIPAIKGMDITLDSFLTPAWTLWYLLSLIWWRSMAFFLIGRMNMKLEWMFGLSIFTALMSGFCPLDDEFSFQRTFYFFPMFLVGALMSHKLPVLDKYRRSIIIGGGIVLIISAILISYLLEPELLRVAFWGKSRYGEFSDMYVRLACLGIGISLSVIIFMLMPQVRVFAMLGVESLVIYLLHPFFVEIIHHKLVDRSIISADAVTMLVCSIVLTGALYLFAKTKIAGFVVHPLTTISNLNKKK